jgi:hypothetical protein
MASVPAGVPEALARGPLGGPLRKLTDLCDGKSLNRISTSGIIRAVALHPDPASKVDAEKRFVFPL